MGSLEAFHFSDSALDIPGRSRIVGHVTLRRLARYRFTGDIWGCPEGECHFPGSLLLVVESTFAGAVMLETLIPVAPQSRLGRRHGCIPDHGGRRARPLARSAGS